MNTGVVPHGMESSGVRMIIQGGELTFDEGDRLTGKENIIQGLTKIIAAF